MTDNSRYIITGASGHIGNNLVRYINKAEPDRKVIALTRRVIERELEGAVVTEIIGELDDLDFLKNNIKKDDIIIHLAGFIDLSDKEKELTFNINYQYTKTLSDFARKNGNRFIYIGSVDGIYKDKTVGEISEPDRYYPEKIMGNYGKSKALATEYVLNAIKSDKNFSAAIVLPSAVMGINDYKPSAVGKIILDSVKGKPEFGIRGGYNFVDVNDLCFVIYSLINSEKTGQYIVSGENVSVKDMYLKINAALGIKKRPIILPDFIVNSAVPFIKILNPITLKSLREKHNYSSKKAVKELNLSTTPIDKTINDTVNWFYRHKNNF